MPNPDDNNNNNNNERRRDAPQGASQVDAGASDYFEWLPPEIFFYYIYPHLNSVDVARLAMMAKRYRDLKVAVPEDLWERFCEDIFKQVKPEGSPLTHREFFESRCADLGSAQKAMQPPRNVRERISGTLKRSSHPGILLMSFCEKGLIPALEQFSHENEGFLNGLKYEACSMSIEISISNNHPHVLRWLLDRFQENWGNKLVAHAFRYTISARKPDYVRYLAGSHYTSFRDLMSFFLDNGGGIADLGNKERREILDIFIGKATAEEITQLFDEYGQQRNVNGFLRQLSVINYEFGNLVPEGREERVGLALRDLNIHINAAFYYNDDDHYLVFESVRLLVATGQNNFRLFGEVGEIITYGILSEERIFSAVGGLNAVLNRIKAICEDSDVNEEEANNNLRILFCHLRQILLAKPWAYSWKEDQVVDSICEILEAHPEVCRLTVDGKTLFDYFFYEGNKTLYFAQRGGWCSPAYLRMLACMVRLNGQSLEESAALRYAKQFRDQEAIDVLTDPTLLGNHRDGSSEDRQGRNDNNVSLNEVVERVLRHLKTITKRAGLQELYDQGTKIYYKYKDSPEELKRFLNRVDTELSASFPAGKLPGYAQTKETLRLFNDILRLTKPYAEEAAASLTDNPRAGSIMANKSWIANFNSEASNSEPEYPAGSVEAYRISIL